MRKTVMLLCLLTGAALFAGTPTVSRDALIKSEVETAVSMLAALEMKHLLGELSRDEAMALGADLLRDLRYGEEGYFWADTEAGVNVVLYGRKDVEGRSRIDARDSDGVYYIREFLRLAKEGGGFVEYRFPKLGETRPVPKRSYVKPFKPFGWVIGSGYYKE
jgi:methyl-accepting chemotaxis protein